MMSKTFLLIIALALMAVVWAHSKRHGGFKTVKVDKFERLIADSTKYVLLDVRTPGEFKAGHLPGALMIDWNGEDFETVALETLSKEKTVAVYCRSGRRSASATGTLVKHGYRVVNLSGGIMAWIAAGKPVEK